MGINKPRKNTPAMDRAEFDKFADEFAALHAQNIKISGEDPDFFAAYKIGDVKREVARAGAFAGYR